MLIEEEEVEKRLNNPLNLMNRMRVGLTSQPKRDAMSLFTKGKIENKIENKEKVEVSFSSSSKENLVPTKVTSPLPSDFSSDNLNDSDAKIKLAIAHDSALDLLTSSIGSLKNKLNNNEIKASSIPSIITSASRVITDIRKERLERDKNRSNENVHFHFYCPEQRKIEDYEVIEVNG